jgi:23S rRNA-/tRNA-specific pseudouridylate synthase
MNSPFIINEYDDVYFIYKPAYWIVNISDESNRTTLAKFRAENKAESSFPLWVHDNLKKKINKDIKVGFGILNRLDKETSGIVMVAKDKDSYIKYRKNINDHRKTNKIYYTLVEGHVKHRFGVITLPLKTEKVSAKSQKTVVDMNDGKYSYTEYITISRYTHENKKYSLLLVKIKTGRTHHIRVHLQNIGHIIFCDKVYNDKSFELKEQCNMSKRLFLHATYYRLEENKEGYIKLPSPLKRLLSEMELKKDMVDIDNAFEILKSNIITDNFIDK